MSTRSGNLSNFPCDLFNIFQMIGKNHTWVLGLELSWIKLSWVEDIWRADWRDSFRSLEFPQQLPRTNWTWGLRICRWCVRMSATWSYAVSCPKPRCFCGNMFETFHNNSKPWHGICGMGCVSIYICYIICIYIYTYTILGKKHDKFMCTVVAICQNAVQLGPAVDLRSQWPWWSQPQYLALILGPLYIFQQKRHVLLYDILQKWAIQAKSHIIGYSMV